MQVLSNMMGNLFINCLVFINLSINSYVVTMVHGIETLTITMNFTNEIYQLNPQEIPLFGK